jgi:hypothetical protein
VDLALPEELEFPDLRQLLPEGIVEVDGDGDLSSK